MLQVHLKLIATSTRNKRLATNGYTSGPIIRPFAVANLEGCAVDHNNIKCALFNKAMDIVDR